MEQINTSAKGAPEEEKHQSSQPQSGEVEQSKFFLPFFYKHEWGKTKAVLQHLLKQKEVKPVTVIETLRELCKLNKHGPAPHLITFQPLQSYFQQLKAGELKSILNQVMRFMAEQCLLVETLFKKETLPLLLANIPDQKLVLSQHQALSLVANMFFCTYPAIYQSKSNPEKGSKKRKMPDCNFFHMLTRNDKMPKKDNMKVKKLHFIFNYFREAMNNIQEISQQQEFIEICRVMLPESHYSSLTPAFWQSSTIRMSKRLEIKYGGKIEEQPNATLSNFANEYIGGGSLNSGTAQEEILFLIYPEMYSAMLVCEPMGKNESVLVLNVRRYSNYGGFGQSLEFLGTFQGQTRDDYYKDILAMDAIKYSKVNSDEESQMSYILRDLNKCYIAFTEIQGTRWKDISSGKWGCGVFNGNPQVKFIEQWLAASQVERPLFFNIFDSDDLLEKIERVVQAVSNMTVGEVFTFLSLYSEGQQTLPLFDCILQWTVSKEDQKMDIA